MIRLRQDVYHGQTRRSVIGNTLTVKVGDVINADTATAGCVTNATAQTTGNYYVLGLVTGFCGPNGEVVARGQSSVGTNTPAQVTTISTNKTAAYTGELTGGQICAQWIPITPEMEFLATLSGAAGTTQTYSGLAFTWYNLSDCRTVDETTVILYYGATAPLQVLAVPSGKDATSALDELDSANLTTVIRFAKAGLYQP